MENRFKTELECEVASNAVYGGFLEHFGLKLRSQNWVHFPKLEILNSLEFACIDEVAFDLVFGPSLATICVNFGAHF